MFPPRVQPMAPLAGTTALEFQGRRYYQHGSDATSPLLIVLHGGASSGLAMERLTGFSTQSNLRVIYPDGVGGNWNDGRADENSAAWRQGVDDLGFLRGLMASSRNVYLVGFSNGAIMAGRVAASRPDGMRGLVCVRGALTPDIRPTRATGLRVLLLEGPGDPLVPYAGGTLWGGRGSVLSARDSLQAWNQAGAQSTLEDLPGRSHDWTPAITERICSFVAADGP